MDQEGIHNGTNIFEENISEKLTSSLKRRSKCNSNETTASKKGRFTEKTVAPAYGLIMVHAACCGYSNSKVLHVEGKNLLEVINDLEICFTKLKTQLEIDAVELDNENQLDIGSFNDVITKKNDSEPKKEKNEQIPVSSSIYNNEIRSPENDTKFKHPMPDHIKTIQNRFSSSTTSSSIPASSSASNRLSITSMSTQSESSVDLVVRRSDSPILETSDSSIEQNEPKNIPNTDDEAEAVKVYARWKSEKYYYSGIVKSHIYSEYVQVFFDDFSIETIKQSDILLRELLPIGTEVMVDLENSGSFVKNFVIVDHVDIAKFKSKPRRGYVVLCRTTDERYEVNRDCVSVHKDIVVKILANDRPGTPNFNSLNVSSSNISTENILCGKRNIKYKRFSQFISPSLIRVKRCNSPSILSAPLTSPYAHRKISKLSNPRLMNTNLDASGNFSQNRKLLSNYYFMITQEDTPDDLNITTKDSVMEMIIADGGKVIEVPTQDEIANHRLKECNIVLIVLGSSYRTIKFMIALAVGNVPIVRVDWLEECVRCSSLVAYDAYLVPKISNENSEEIRQILGEDKISIFQNFNICLVNDSLSSLCNHWKTVLEIAGANVTMIDKENFSTDICVQHFHFVVVKSDEATADCISFLKEHAIAVVDINYVIDSLVLNRALEIDP